VLYAARKKNVAIEKKERGGKKTCYICSALTPKKRGGHNREYMIDM